MGATPAEPATARHGPRVREAHFRGEPADVRAARQFVQEAVATLGVRPLQEAVLAASELVSNAIRHAATPFEVRVLVDRAHLRVEVQDGSPGLPQERRPGPAEPTGRGLQIVRQCSHRWGVMPQGGRGKVVWFEIDHDAGPADPLNQPSPGAAATPAAPNDGDGDGSDTLASVGARLVAERDPEALAQLVAERATGAVGAAFGAFFTMRADEAGDGYLTVSASGCDPEIVAELPMPGTGSLPGTAIGGGPIVRLADVRAARARGLPPPRAVPARHPPVRSYLGVPVVSPTGRVHGGLVLGHPEAGRFDARSERLAAGIARFAAVALDTADALDRARREASSASDIAAWLHTVVEASPVGVAILDRELRWVLVNDAMATMDGFAADEHLGRHPGEALPDLSTEVVGAMRQVLDTGRPVVGLEVEARTPADPDSTRSWLSSYFPIADDTGTAAWVGVVAVDITERREAEAERHRIIAQASAAGAAAARAQAQLELLAEVGRWGSSPVAVDQLLRGIGRLIVPAFADVAAVSLVGEEGRVGPHLLGGDEVPAELRGAAHALLRSQSNWGGPTPAALALRRGRGRAVPDPAGAVGGDGAGVRSALVVPTTLRHQVTGLLALGSRTPGAFGDGDVPFWEEVGRRLGATLDTAENRVRQDRIVHTLQAALLPLAPPAVTGLTVAARYQPAAHDQFGGDWWDAFEADGGLVVTVGDVVGHDLAAAAAMGHLRMAARAYATEHRDLGAVLERLSEFAGRDPATDLATAVLALVEPTAGTVRWWRAGHPPPLLVRDRTVEVLDGPVGPPLGLPQWPATREVRLQPGDTLVLYTDGLYEQRGRTLAERLDELARGAGALRHAPLDELCDGLLAAMVNPHAQADDVALVAVRRRANA